MIFFKKLKANLHWLVIALSVVLVWRWVDHALAKSQNIMKPISEGVISGVITSLFILIFTALWRSKISEWLENITYRDARIEGVWQGFLLPYIGIREIDRLRLQAAWLAVMNESSERTKSQDPDDAVTVEASVVSSTDETTSSSAELILPSEESKTNLGSESAGKKSRSIKIGISVKPIKIRAELIRVGNRVKGRLIEIGGASEVHTYYIDGTFKNLMLCGKYENENPQNIDRGSFSLMLRENGSKFEGFFASYSEKGEEIYPFRCELKRNTGGISGSEIA
ncbi:MAG: hypothetical protein DCF32_20045 [Leptolyngbya sp.]|nr:MAG: hypothetical protein DCF32_20045 [Leptolyngbya sp.]